MNSLETILTLFTIDKNVVKVLLFQRKDDDLDWFLPYNEITSNETIEKINKDTLFQYTLLNNINLSNVSIFSDIDRIPDKRIIAASYIGIVPISKLKKNKFRNIVYKWFDINNLPKTVYDHKRIINESITYLKEQVRYNKLINLFFDDAFTLIELQSLYEFAYSKKLDRRNFRKYALTNLKIIDSKKLHKTKNGRPSKLYYFNNEENLSLKLLT